MNLSSVIVPPLLAPIKTPDVNQFKPNDINQFKPSDVYKRDDDRRYTQPTVQAPLPPGQGTRVDRLV